MKTKEKRTKGKRRRQLRLRRVQKFRNLILRGWLFALCILPRGACSAPASSLVCYRSSMLTVLWREWALGHVWRCFTCVGGARGRGFFFTHSVFTFAL